MFGGCGLCDESISNCACGGTTYELRQKLEKMTKLFDGIIDCLDDYDDLAYAVKLARKKRDEILK